MNEKLVLGDTKVTQIEFEEKTRPPYLLDQIYPDLVERHPDVIEIIEPLLARYAHFIRPKGYSFDAVRSGFHRLISPNSITDQVKFEFVYVNGEWGLKDDIWSELARGSDDFDGYVGKIRQGEDEVTRFTSDELNSLGQDFLEVADAYLPSILSMRSYEVIEHLRERDEETQNDVIQVLSSGENSSQDYEFKVKFGRHERKPEVTVGKIQVVDLLTGREIFVFDLGFYTDYLQNRRFGLLVDEASQLGATLVATEADTLALDPKYTMAELDEKLEQLMGPDSWRTTAFDRDIPADAERVLRAIRVKLFNHKEPILPDNIYGSLFVEGGLGWDRINGVLQRAIEYLDQPLVGNAEMVEKEIRRRVSLQKKLTKELLVMTETDPYLVLLIANRTPLLRIFPAFRYVNQDFFSELLRREAFYFQGHELYPIPEGKRTPKSILESRIRWLEERRMVGGYSGLKLFHDAYSNETRSGENRHLTSDEARFLYSKENGGQFGLFGFEEMKDRPISENHNSGVLYGSFFNRRFRVFLKTNGIYLPEYSYGDSREIRPKFITSFSDGLNFAVLRLGEIVNSRTKNFSLEFLFDDGVTVIPPRFREEVQLQLYAAGFIRPFGSDRYEGAKLGELEDFPTVERLWHRDDRDEWTKIRHKYERILLKTIENMIKTNRTDRRKKDHQGSQSPTVIAKRLSQRFVEYFLRRFYPSSALYNYHTPPDYLCHEWMSEQPELVGKKGK